MGVFQNTHFAAHSGYIIVTGGFLLQYYPIVTIARYIIGGLVGI